MLNPARRAALHLAALRPTDRRWLLDRLDRIERERLEPLLSELQHHSPASIAEVLATLEAPSIHVSDPSSTSTTHSDSQRTLDGISDTSLATAMDQLPASSVELLQGQISEHRLVRLRAHRTGRREILERPPVTEAFAEALVQLLRLDFAAAPSGFESLLAGDGVPDELDFAR